MAQTQGAAFARMAFESTKLKMEWRQSYKGTDAACSCGCRACNWAAHTSTSTLELTKANVKKRYPVHLPQYPVPLFRFWLQICHFFSRRIPDTCGLSVKLVSPGGNYLCKASCVIAATIRIRLLFIYLKVKQKLHFSNCSGVLLGVMMVKVGE